MDMDLKRLAKLSRLKFTPDEEARYQADMERIVAMVEKLPDLDASGPLIDPDNPMSMREDKSERLFSRDELLKNAPEVQAGCVVVPRTVE